MALSDAQFRSLSARIAELVGIHIATEKRWLLSARVKQRLEALGDLAESDYVAKVLDNEGAEELGHLVEALRVGETQFYRHAGQLRAIERVALPEIIARRQRDGTRKVRVWSAGCASGEEPYTLAMLLDSVLNRSMTFEILATDLSESALASARQGRYPRGALRAVPDEVADAAFDPDGDDVVIRPHLRGRVKFEQRNLLDAPYPHGFDLLLCRNVLIYFGRATQHEVLARLARSVLPGGYLALGYSERLDAGDGELLPLRTDDGVIYRRADQASRVVIAAEAPKAPVRVKRHPKRTDTGPRTADPATAPGTGPKTETETKTPRPQLTGDLSGPEGAAVARAALAPIVAGAVKPPVLSVHGLLFADDDVLRVLARAAAAIAAHGEPLRIAGASAGLRHFFVRHHVLPPAVIDSGSDESDT